MSADNLHQWATLIVGVPIPRKFIRGLSPYKREKLIAFVDSVWARANDNDDWVVERPKWLPKKYVYGA